MSVQDSLIVSGVQNNVTVTVILDGVTYTTTGMYRHSSSHYGPFYDGNGASGIYFTLRSNLSTQFLVPWAFANSMVVRIKNSQDANTRVIVNYQLNV
jgi:hypothetical protein